MKEYRIKFKPTGIVFTLPAEEIQRIILADHGHNYEVLDKGVIVPREPVNLVTTTYEQVVETEEVRGLEDYTHEELKKFAKENNLKVSGSKADLLERCLEFTRQLAEAQEKEGTQEAEEVQECVPDNAPIEEENEETNEENSEVVETEEEA